MKKYISAGQRRDFDFDFANDIDWEGAAKDLGVTLTEESIGYNAPESWTPDPNDTDQKYFARTTCGRYLVVDGLGEARLAMPEEYAGTHGEPIF